MKLEILRAVWGKQEGFVFVPRRKKRIGKDLWDEGRAFSYPDEWDAIKERLIESEKEGYDVYWCPQVFEKPKRLKENVKLTQSILWADLDYVDPNTLGILKPSIAWKSSDDRFQGLWALDTSYDINTIEEVNKNLTYHIGADKGGWDVTQVLRVPGSKNFKYDPPQQGELLWAKKIIFELDKVAEVVKPTESVTSTEETLESLLEGWDIPERAMELLMMDESEVEVGERSDRLWEIEALLIEAGLPVLDVVKIIHKSPWNKFKGRRNEMEQIYREVLKVEQHVKSRARASGGTILIDPTASKAKLSNWAIPFMEFASKEIEKPSWLVEGIWQKGTYGMFAGEPKTYKSVQATDLALSVASGHPFLGEFKVLQKGTVLYIQEENNEQTVQDRVFKIAHAKGLLTATESGLALPDDLPIHFSNNYGIDLTQKESRDLVEETIAQINPILVILDPLYMMLGKTDENSAKEVGEVLRWLTYLRNTYGVAILVCHHYGKGSPSTRGGQRVRGTSAFHAWVESALYMKVTDESGVVKVEREFRSFPSTPEITVRIEMGEPGRLHYKASVDETTPDKSVEALTREEICSILSSSPRDETELSKLVKVSRKDLTRILADMERGGVIRRESGRGGRGRTAKYVLA